jgi:hypothetical protein
MSVVRAWKQCEWAAGGERTCHVPVALAPSTSVMRVRWRPARLCAYHRYRAGQSLRGLYTTEEAFFLAWLQQFPPGTRYQPVPGIWDLDRAQLWKLVNGSISFDEFKSRINSHPVRS